MATPSASKKRIVTDDILGRYRLIRAVYRTYFTLLDVPVQKISTEFFYVVGDVLEGRPLGSTKLRYLNLEDVQRVLKEGS